MLNDLSCHDEHHSHDHWCSMGLTVDLFDFPEISEQEVFMDSAEPELPVHKATAGPITNRLLKATAHVITYLLNLSLKFGTLPTCWKTAQVVPIFKKKNPPSDPINYHPISLLPAIQCQAAAGCDCCQTPHPIFEQEEPDLSGTLSLALSAIAQPWISLY